MHDKEYVLKVLSILIAGLIVGAVIFFLVGARELQAKPDISSKTNALLQKYFDLKQKYEQEVEEKDQWIEVEMTGYSANDPSQGTNHITANGVNLNKVWTDEVNLFAVDPDVIPLNTIIAVKIDDCRTIYGLTVDTGGLIKGYKIDWHRTTKDLAKKVGRKKVEVKILD